MRRITIWITATLAIVALAIAYQLNAAGIGGKDGDEGDHAPTTVQEVPAPESDTTAPSGDKPEGETHEGTDSKPGENK